MLLKDSKIPLGFWDYAVKLDAYVRNRLKRSSWIENYVDVALVYRKFSLEGACTGIYTQKISHLRVWGNQAIPYVDINSMPSVTV